MGMSDRAFRFPTSGFWDIWPIIPICDEMHHVIYMDGIWIARHAVLLIACTDEHVIGCHLARSENPKDWACLMSRIAPPDVLVCDGGGGILKAGRTKRPASRIQRCTFHAFCQVRRYTTSRPKIQAGIELYGIARNLLHVRTQDEAAGWLASFSRWCTNWDGFLKERSIVDGKKRYRHERLRKARRGLEGLCRAGTLFTYLDDDIIQVGSVEPTSNTIEGKVNAQIGSVLRNHRGLDADRRIKAGFWWCYMHSESPLGEQGILEEMPTDEDIRRWRWQAAGVRGADDELARWGSGIVWSEFHMTGSRATGWF